MNLQRMKRVVSMVLSSKASYVVSMLMVVFLAACVTPTENPAGYEKRGNSENIPPGLELSAEEKVTIRFAGIPNPPPPHEERIREDGNIHPPYLSEPVKALGLTPPQLRTKLYEAYVPRIFTTISITVLTEERLITVNGEVARSGRYPYVGETTAVEAISQAGGLTDFARKRKLTVIRGNGLKFTFDYEKARRESQFDPPIYPGDIIDVPKRLY